MMNKLSSFRQSIAQLMLLLIMCLIAFGLRPTASLTEAATGLPPLPSSCVTVGLPLPPDFGEVVCCVSGYVYQNGVPIAGVEVSAEFNGQTVTVTTSDDSNTPHFATTLNDTLGVQPGDTVRLTATLGDQSVSTTFVARAGGQQVDLVLPVAQTTGEWQARGPYGLFQYETVFDEQRNELLLIGERQLDENNGQFETWVWANDAWTLRHILATDIFMLNFASIGFSPAYDPGSQQVIAYVSSGPSDKFVSIWTWTGQSWLEQWSTPEPEEPDGFVAYPYKGYWVYDSQQERMLLLGRGLNFDVTQDVLTILEWTGSALEPIEPQNSPFESQLSSDLMCAVYDEVNDDIVAVVVQSEVNQTWRLNGVSWQKVTSALSTPDLDRYSGNPFHCYYDPAANRVAVVHTSNYQLGDSTRVYHLTDFDWETVTAFESLTYDNLQHNRTTNQTIALSELGHVFSLESDQWQKLYHSPAAAPFSEGAQIAVLGNNNYLIQDASTSILWSPIQDSVENNSTNQPDEFGNMLAGDGSGVALSFGGYKSGYQSTTRLYDALTKRWQIVTPATTPMGRLHGALVYSEVNNGWLLFGGAGASATLNDTWLFDGINWQQLTPSTSPPARAQASLVWDDTNGQAILYGGVTTGGTLDDIWLWDGATWSEQATVGYTPGGLVGHAAVYDSSRGVMLVIGGAGNVVPLSTVNAWDGGVWVPYTTDAAPKNSAFDAVYDEAYGAPLVVSSIGTGPKGQAHWYEVLGSAENSPPVATISFINPRDAQQNVDTITMVGRGMDADLTGNITTYEWTVNGTVVGTAAEINIPASDLPLGENSVSLRVQDDEGDWSPAVTQTLFIRAENDATEDAQWTHLVYLAADNNLDAYLGTNPLTNGLIWRLRGEDSAENVNMVLLYDPPGATGSFRYTLAADGTWAEEALPEQRMDEIATLRNFIEWGSNRFASDYTALSIVDHANGVVGIAQDLSSDSSGGAFLTPLQLRLALQGATDDGARKLDVIHFDGCSFGLFEDAAIVDNLVNYVVASPNTAWGVFAYDAYRNRAFSAESPADYAQIIGEEYVNAVTADGDYPYTISVFDMAQFDAVNTALSNFGDALLSYVQGSNVRRAEVRTLRDSAAQFYDSRGDLALSAQDDYVDIVDWAQAAESALPDATIVDTATSLIETITGAAPFITWEEHGSGTIVQNGDVIPVSLDGANGLAVFYPPAASTDSGSAFYNYINNLLFDTTRDSGWTKFLLDGLPAQGGGGDMPLPGDALNQPLFQPQETVPMFHNFLPVINS